MKNTNNSKEKYHIIVNRAACSGKGINAWKIVQRVLHKEHVLYKVYMPVSREETILLVQTLTEGTEDIHIIVVGGDGTLNTVLQGIRSFKTTRISCIRCGSGNDFARNMSLTKNPAAAMMSIIRNPKETILDYGEAAYQVSAASVMRRRRFIISCGIGFDADICHDAEKSHLKKVLNHIKLGRLVYVFIGIKKILTRFSSAAVVTVDQKEKMKVPLCYFSVGMLHACEGGGVPFCPDADPTDGKLDICVVKQMPKIKFMCAVPMVFLKKLDLFEEVHHYRGIRMVVTTKRPEWFHVDGETSVKIRRLELECKQGLRFVY